MKTRQVIFRQHDSTASSPIRFSVQVAIGNKDVRRFFARNFKLSFEDNVLTIAKSLGLIVLKATMMTKGAILDCDPANFDTLLNYFDLTGASGIKKKYADKKHLVAPL